MRVIVFDTETTGLVPNSYKHAIHTPEYLRNCPHIVQLSWIVYDTTTKTIEDIEDYVIDIPNDVTIPNRAINVHGITNKICAEHGIPIEDALKKLKTTAHSCNWIVGHNMLFDYNMVNIECKRLGWDPNVIFTRLNTQHDNDNDYEDEDDDVSMNVLDGAIPPVEYVSIPRYCTMLNGRTLCKLKQMRRDGTVYYKRPKLVELYEHLFERTPTNLHNSIVDCMVTLRCFLKMNTEDDFVVMDNEYIQNLVFMFQPLCYSNVRDVMACL
jgi:DNA polymerase III epsilon subunit-like protein